MGGKKCTWCGHEGAEQGFMADLGQYSSNYGVWVEGPLEVGPLGRARLMNRTLRAVYAYRCTNCSHLELFANDPRS